MNPGFFRPRLLSLSCLVFSLIGCGGDDSSGKKPAQVEERAQIEQFLASISDMAGVPGRFSTRFVSGSAPSPAEMARYEEFEYATVQQPRIDGANCSVRVRISKAEQNDQVVGEVDWTLKKEGEEWKLVSAPLP